MTRSQRKLSAGIDAIGKLREGGWVVCEVAVEPADQWSIADGESGGECCCQAAVAVVTDDACRQISKGTLKSHESPVCRAIIDED